MRSLETESWQTCREEGDLVPSTRFFFFFLTPRVHTQLIFSACDTDHCLYLNK